MAAIIVLTPVAAERLITATFGNPDAYLDPRSIDVGEFAGMYALSPECAADPIYADLAKDMASTADVDVTASFTGKGADPWDAVKTEISAAVAADTLEEVRAEKLEALIDPGAADGLVV